MAYPTLHLLWIENARRARRGLPLILVPLIDTPAANRMRALRQLRRRREDYDAAQVPVRGVLGDRLPHRPPAFQGL